MYNRSSRSFRLTTTTIMTHPIRTYAPTALLAALLTFAPVVMHAQTPPAPLPPGTHPNAVPPTKAPTRPLPVKTLPNGELHFTGNSSAAAVPDASSAGPGGQNSPIDDTTILYTFFGIGIIVLAGMGWFFVTTKKNV